MNQYDIILVSTCITDKYIYRLISEILSNNQSVKCLLILILQNGIQLHDGISETELTTIKVISIPNIVNSSKARNIGIQEINKNNYIGRYIYFPDDDSILDNYFFSNFKSLTATNCSYVIPTRCIGSFDYYNRKYSKFKSGFRFGKKQVMLIGTLSFLINFETFNKIGYFDEDMGVGAKYGAGEDGDYYLRAIKYGPMIYEARLYTLHPSPNDTYSQLPITRLIERHVKYGEGVIYMLCKHRLYGSAVICAFKAIASCFINFLKGDFDLAIAKAYAIKARFSMLSKYFFSK